MDFYQKLGLATEKANAKVYYNVPNNLLIEKSVQKGHGHLTKDGALRVVTGKNTGRSAQDKYVVKSPTTEKSIWWENALRPMTAENFEKLKQKAISYLNEADREVFITERSVGAEEKHNIGTRVISTHPHHILFSNHMFRAPMGPMNDNAFTILHVPEMNIDPSDFNVRAETVITTCFDTKVTIIVGSLYAGEIKKSMFSIMNYILPEKKVLPMHSGASHLPNNEVSVFFGLSGTGKTTLSCDEGTLLIGDDEHGLSDEGVFNFEGGCYAKTYKLSKETEPGIYKASTRFGSLLENVVMDEKTGAVDFFDKSIAENGRSSYPLSFIEELEKTSKGNVPSHIFFLSADAFGVLPPVAKLTKEQAMFYFVLGYTAKLAGTEIGVKEPSAAFSPCFGAPFMIRHPSVYAELLGHYLDKYKTNVWLINTGWTGGAYGTGERFPLATTRTIIRAIQSNEMNNVDTTQEQTFGFHIPTHVSDIPQSVLHPEQSWPNKADYEKKSKELAVSFHNQMQKFGDFYQTNINGAPLFKA